MDAKQRKLREIGSAVLSVPVGWVFSLFFQSGCAHVERYNARRGVQQYEESAWADDVEHEHELRLAAVHRAIAQQVEREPVAWVPVAAQDGRF